MLQTSTRIGGSIVIASPENADASAMSIRVLLVEDDHDFRDSLQTFLSEAGLEVRALSDARALATEMEASPPDVVVLDLNLPGQDGFSAAFSMRKMGAVGIVVLTGRTEKQDRFHGLSIGVDHYLTKPTDPAELELVIRNLYRRLRPADGKTSERAAAGEWIFHSSQWILKSPAGTDVTLSNTEYQVIERLFARPGEPVARADILPPRDGQDAEEAGRSLDLIVFRLRRKVERECGCALPLLSVRGIGYVFAGKVRPAAN